MIQTLCRVMQLFKGSYFSVGAIAKGTDARIFELCFTCFKVEYKKKLYRVLLVL